MKILVADDDRVLADVITFTLRKEGFDVILAHDGAAALRRWKEDAPDLLLLDVNMPKMGGFEVCRTIRAEADTPIIMLTVRREEEDILSGFEVGADDYVVKPFSPSQLVARVKAVLRRSDRKPVAAELELGEIRFLASCREVWLKDHQEPISLTHLENRLLEYLMINAGLVLTNEMIIDNVWGPAAADRDMLRQLVHRLRKKIENDPAQPVLIKTIPGLGYGFQKD